MIAGGGIGTVVLVVVALLLGVDPEHHPAGSGGGPGYVEEQPSGAPAGRADDELSQFVAVVLADTEDTWTELFKQAGRPYEEPRLVLFSGMVQSACGIGQAAMGPFYCPGDRRVYIDLSFYRDLQSRFGAPGDFAQAYVIAHEVGHHVQNLLGIMDKVNAGARPHEQGRGQRAVGADRAAGRLLRRHLGAPCAALAPGARAGRPRGGADRRERHRRRPPAEAEPGPRGAGVLHPRQLGAAHDLVQARLRRPARGARATLRAQRVIAAGSQAALPRAPSGRVQPARSNSAAV